MTPSPSNFFGGESVASAPGWLGCSCGACWQASGQWELVAIGVGGSWVAWLVAVFLASWNPRLGRRYRWVFPGLARVNVDYVSGAAEAATERVERPAERKGPGRSSARNELFLRARALGLLLWSELLSRRGALERSREVLHLVVDRDPEAEAANRTSQADDRSARGA